ncbi:tRNA epoxyqueuosine(34) reductase QueG [Anabaena sp. FACHB-1237]|uniref:tRNA epoxyqueuosine(34) reductase QueG n=1 Tax=Anabaena sp. FACHB-1237 TaxID=2692769 RepID=UPI001680CCD8|nr:tRNA epoxyqueuosine(34) reductase QueG [Anabaena sp. FACHB-1237]MBD2138804.1 tRNA epoxyqueuosine(34) reductase QueG [Anabaena sp. FACHB-1237]
MNKPTSINSIAVKQKAQELGFHRVGITTIGEDHQAQNRLQSWLDAGFHSQMAWMKNPARENIKLVMPDARSLICVALNYYTDHAHSLNPKHGKISRYAWGRDYHKVMGKKLKMLASWLQSLDQNIQVRYYVDTGPVQDKVWAEKAGIGWIAKNGNLITRDYGSWVFLGEILINIELDSDRPATQHCGTCTRCLDACPTHAIIKPYVVDANKCIAYHTIENRDEKLPPAIAQNLQGWVAGCDICQDVCPWNQRFAKVTDIEDFQPYPGNLSPHLVELAQISNQEWDQQFTASALRRIKPEMFRRNARANLDASRQNNDPKSNNF